jgi:hypothetical protein
MAVIHIPEEEAVRDFGAVLVRLDAGSEVVIDRATGGVRLHRATPTHPLTFVEAIARLPKNSAGVIDEEFEADARNFRDRHPESIDSTRWD